MREVLRSYCGWTLPGLVRTQAVSGDYAVTGTPRVRATFPVMGPGDEVLATFRGRGFR
jgi:hypothetical protein